MTQSVHTYNTEGQTEGTAECTLTVIVPVYNAGSYVTEGILSLLSQSVIGMTEIIVVDDHGTDDSRSKIEKLQLEHPFGSHIRIVETPCNSGAWAARNLGLAEARGRWIGFMDADDWCEGFMYEALLTAAEEKNADWGHCIAQKEYDNGRSELLFQPGTEDGSFSDADRKTMLTKGVAYFTTAIYRREFLQRYNITFPPGKFSEDSYFWYMSVMHAERIVSIPLVGYHYRIQQNSVSKRPDPTKAQQKQKMYDEFIVRLRNEEKYEKYKEELDYLYIKKGLLIPMIIQAINNPKTISEESRRMIVNMEENLKIEYKKNSYYKSDLRSAFLMSGFTHFPKMMSRLLRMKFERDPF